MVFYHVKLYNSWSDRQTMWYYVGRLLGWNGGLEYRVEA
ncbi:hypothetical protein SBF1_1280025 [Candidatus Desulfosporosinus infrequens]|uniref:Uncharacterized protein n=1 Tax=Candidatus Desulfosporosinus infrequens TaxID=2043169 RepID=A0A2U3K3C1_9FIRM|nr:hypothetical protein SBF1_1280025 [Candidatus Desulfosporosinus infrequens]